jgi:hypothetical protein
MRASCARLPLGQVHDLRGGSARLDRTPTTMLPDHSQVRAATPGGYSATAARQSDRASKLLLSPAQPHVELRGVFPPISLLTRPRWSG